MLASYRKQLSSTSFLLASMPLSCPLVKDCRVFWRLLWSLCQLVFPGCYLLWHSVHKCMKQNKTKQKTNLKGHSFLCCDSGPWQVCHFLYTIQSPLTLFFYSKYQGLCPRWRCSLPGSPSAWTSTRLTWHWTKSLCGSSRHAAKTVARSLSVLHLSFKGGCVEAGGHGGPGVKAPAGG